MAEKMKMSERDNTLIKILERLGGELQRQGLLLEDVVARQSELSQTLHSTGYQLSSQQSESEKEYAKILDSISRYRSDMLSLVNEQDHINEGFKELRKVVNQAAFDLENNSKRLEDLENRIKAREKATRDHYEDSHKQAESTKKEIADSGRNVTRLHADTEKRLGEMHRETQRLLDKLNQDTTRRLLVLDGIDAALGTLLIRTEPPEKKPLWIVRVFNMVGAFFRIKLPMYIKTVFIRSK